jgi:hypothetical protein
MARQLPRLCYLERAWIALRADLASFPSGAIWR